MPCSQLSRDYAAPVPAGASWVWQQGDALRFMNGSFLAAERIRQSVPLFLLQCDGLIFIVEE